VVIELYSSANSSLNFFIQSSSLKVHRSKLLPYFYRKQSSAMSDQTPEMEDFDPQNAKHKGCLNCGYAFKEGDIYCGNCSQKRHLHLSVGDLMHEFTHMLTHLDSKFFKMLHHLFIPGRVTSDFIAGKRKTYPHPVRFFIVTSAIFLLVFYKTVAPQFSAGMSDSLKDGKSNIGSIYEPVLGPTLSYAARTQDFFFDSLGQSKRDVPAGLADSIISVVFGLNRDSSLLKILSTGEGGGFSINFSSTSIPIKDLFVTDPDTLMNRYELDQRTSLKKYVSKQFLKASQSPSAFFSKYGANFAFTFLGMILLQALVLKLLYVRSRRYYVEHVLVLMNIGTAMLISLILLFFMHEIPGLGDYFSTIGFLWLVCFLYFNYKTLRVVYKQSRGRTVLKFILFSLSYLFNAFAALTLSFIGTALLIG
jgi:hypothetical protein